MDGTSGIQPYCDFEDRTVVKKSPEVNGRLGTCQPVETVAVSGFSTVELNTHASRANSHNSDCPTYEEGSMGVRDGEVFPRVVHSPALYPKDQPKHLDFGSRGSLQASKTHPRGHTTARWRGGERGGKASAESRGAGRTLIRGKGPSLTVHKHISICGPSKRGSALIARTVSTF